MSTLDRIDLTRVAKSTASVVTHLRSASTRWTSESFTTSSVVAALPTINHKRVLNALGYLKKRGYIARVGYGIYRVLVRP